MTTITELAKPRHQYNSLYKKYFQTRDFITPKHLFSGYYNVRKYIYRHQYIGRRFLDQRLLCSAPISTFRNDSQKGGAGSTFTYLTLSDSREFQKDSFSDKTPFNLTREVTSPTTDRLCSFFLRALK